MKTNFTFHRSFKKKNVLLYCCFYYMDNILYITLFGFHYINSKHILKSLTTKVFDQLFKTLSAIYLFLHILKPTIL